MKLLFLATRDKKTHLGQDVRAYNGNVIQVNQKRGMILLDSYPDNFFTLPIGVQKLGKPVHRPLKVSDISIVTIQSWPSDVIERNLLSYLPEEIELIKLHNENNKNFTSGAQAYNYGIRKAKNNIVICTHEDLVFKKGWFEGFIKQECRLKNWGAMGIVGMGFDRQMHWGSNYDVPYKVQTLDECCTIVNKKNGLWFDEKTFKHWHSYGVDLCLQAYNKGLNVYVVSGPANHGQRGYCHPKKWWDELEPSHELIKKKWKKIFPSIITTTGVY